MSITVLSFVIRYCLLPLLLVPLLSKSLYIITLISGYTGIEDFSALQVVANDAGLYAVIIGLFYLSLLAFVPYFVAVLLRLLASVLLCIYLVDYFVIVNFNAHLLFSDVFKYASYSLRYTQQTYQDQPLLLVLIIIAGGSYLLLLLTGVKVIGNKIHSAYVITILVLIGSTTLIHGQQSYVHAWVFKNVIDYNLTALSESRAYSKPFIEQLKFEEPYSCAEKSAKNPNVIVLMVESLSSYQSDFFSGVHDWTPHLDNIARQNTAYQQFYANGFTTEDGEISLLTGRLPIPKPASLTAGGGTSFAGFFELADSLPKILKARDYQTNFLTTADLSFSNTGAWLASIGFDYIEGHEHPYYDQWPRYHFSAAPDEALLQRINAVVEQDMAAGKRSFTFAKTVSTHHPFVDPQSNIKSEEAAFRYADRQIGQFYEGLKASGYFEHGLLIIVGDHHAMVPLKEPEIQRFGVQRAGSRVPLIIADGSEVARNINDLYQQTDVYNGLKYLGREQSCQSPWLGNVFGYGAWTAQYIAHRRGDNRDIISVFSGQHNVRIKLDGDKTKVVGQNALSDKINQRLVDKINATRISVKASAKE